MEPKSGIAIMAQHPVSGRVAHPSKSLTYSEAIVFLALYFPVSIYVVNRKELKRVRPAWFPTMIARADQPSISHHCFKASPSVGFLTQLSPVLHEIWVTKFSFPIPLAVRNFFLISKWSLGIVSPNISASPGTKFILLASVFVAVKRFLASRTNEFSLWHGCYHGAIRSHCQ